MDQAGTFEQNLSGLFHQSPAPGGTAVLWGAVNGPGSLHRMVFDGTHWVRDTRNGWAEGKRVRYPDGRGEPDAEGVTFVESSGGGALYVATERNNGVGGVSRNSILRFDPTGSAAELAATHEWDVTDDLPSVGANRGLEGITWVPDSALVGAGFLDEQTGEAYDPARYPDHGDGLFFVGLEANGVMYAYALDHSDGGAARIASLSTGLEAIMGLDYDGATGRIWALCDNVCGNTSVVLEIERGASGQGARQGEPGRFRVMARHARPPGLPDVNNEGFALTPASACIEGMRPVFWSDDDGTDGHSIRQGTVTC